MTYQRGDMWTEAQDELLRCLAGSESIETIAQRLKRSKMAVSSRASRIDVKLRRNGEEHAMARLTDDQVPMVRTLVKAGFPAADVRRAMGLNISAAGFKSIIDGDVRHAEEPDMAEFVAMYELEIKVLKRQYRDLQKCNGNVDRLICQVINKTWANIRKLLREANFAYVYWCNTNKSFTVTRREAKSNKDLIGVYNENCEKDDVRMDIIDIVDAAYRGV